jgi:hypothetical protein
LSINSTLTWETHIENVINKLGIACYMIRNIKPFISANTLKIIYYSYFYSVMTYGLFFWGNSSHADMVFKLQKRVIRLMMGCGYRESCKDLLKELYILPLKSFFLSFFLSFLVQPLST